MTRSLAILSAAVLSAVAQAQCLGAATGTQQTLSATYPGTYVASDEGRTSPAVALGFNFPMAGALPLSSPPGVATHVFIESNGELYLTNTFYGVFTPIGASTFGIDTVPELRGTAAPNSNPRICPLSGDTEAGNGGNWGIFVDTSVANQATIYYRDVWEYSAGVPTGSNSYSCTLYSTGAIDFSYSPGLAANTFGNYIGVSIGNSVGTGAETSQDLSAGVSSGSLGLLFEEFLGGTPDLAGRTIRFTPNGLGGFTTSTVCSGAFNAEYGKGCYGPIASQAIYQYFGSPAAAAALTGQSMKATPAGNGYVFTWGGGAYVPPTGGATTLTQGDDTEADVTPSIPFPHVSGPITTLSVASNGLVNMAPSGTNSTTSYADVFDLLNDPAAAFRTSVDWDFSSSPLGACKSEEIGGILYITFENAERFNTAGNTDTVQFQLNLGTGEVTYVWQTMQGLVGAGTALGTLVGYSPGGSSLDSGSISLATALPVVTSPDYTGSQALALSASPAPVYTIGGPSVPVTWTVNNVPDALPPFGVGVSILIFSVAPLPGGLDLGFVGMPGCDLNLGSLDVTIGFPGASPTDSLTFSVPQPLSPGLSFYSQALSLMQPNSLPNGQNAFGAVLSNGVQSKFDTF